VCTRTLVTFDVKFDVKTKKCFETVQHIGPAACANFGTDVTSFYRQEDRRVLQYNVNNVRHTANVFTLYS
jgi:hypothetical protein